MPDCGLHNGEIPALSQPLGTKPVENSVETVNNLDFTRILRVDTRLFFVARGDFLQLLRRILTRLRAFVGQRQNTCYCGAELL